MTKSLDIQEEKIFPVLKANEPVRIHWATPPHDGVGNALGYQTHIKYLKRFAENGLHTVDAPDSLIALHIISADHFKPIPGKFNVLFTMWEALDVPQTYIDAMNKADLIIVPCSWCKKLFQKHTRVPIEVCWHGTDVDLYKFHDRKNQRIHARLKLNFWSRPRHISRFRFLWVGAPNPRKGYQEILSVLALAEKLPSIEIYLKTTAVKINWLDTIKSLKRNWRRIFRGHESNGSYWRAFWLNLLRIPRPGLSGKVKRLGRHKNVIFDTRMLKREELVELYNSANCFLFPTRGEGWGLTLSEALATGCPAIATRVTGVEEFFDSSVGYEIEHEVKLNELRDYNMTARVYHPDVSDLAKKMIHVMQNYPEALKKGKLGSERLRSKFTWEKSGARLAEIIRSHSHVH